MAKAIRHRPRYHEFRGGSHGGRKARCDHQQRGQPLVLGCRLHHRPANGWSDRLPSARPCSTPKTPSTPPKRFIGRRYSEVAVGAQERAVQSGCRTQRRRALRDHGQTVAPREVSSLVLRSSPTTRQNIWARRSRNAVITVRLTSTTRSARRHEDAGKIAGLNVLRIINEPTARVAWLRSRQKEKRNHHGVRPRRRHVRRLRILEVGDGVFEVRSTSGDTHLGGDDFDKRAGGLHGGRIHADQGNRYRGRPARRCSD